MTTLNEALAAHTTRVERTFNCHVHDDRNASASVNVLKGVWFCYACGAKGRVAGGPELDGLPIGDMLREMLTEDVMRVYPESWLDLYRGDHPYWRSRFTAAAIEHFGLGFDPTTGEATYPLRSPEGALLGVVRRSLNDYGPKYLYPAGSRVSRLLFNFSHSRSADVVLTEGVTDAIAAWEAGVRAFATFRNGVSDAQAQMIRSLDPDRVWVAYDRDKGGDAGYGQVRKMFPRKVRRVTWVGEKDLAEMPLERRSGVLSVVTERRSVLAG